MTVLGMPQMSQMGPISKSCLFWVVTWPLGVEVAISTKMCTYVSFFTPWAFGWYLDVPLKVKCATLIVYSRHFSRNRLAMGIKLGRHSLATRTSFNAKGYVFDVCTRYSPDRIQISCTNFQLKSEKKL